MNIHNNYEMKTRNFYLEENKNNCFKFFTKSVKICFFFNEYLINTVNQRQFAYFVTDLNTLKYFMN